MFILAYLLFKVVNNMNWEIKNHIVPSQLPIGKHRQTHLFIMDKLANVFGAWRGWTIYFKTFGTFGRRVYLEGEQRFDKLGHHHVSVAHRRRDQRMKEISSVNWNTIVFVYIDMLCPFQHTETSTAKKCPKRQKKMYNLTRFNFLLQLQVMTDIMYHFS